MLYYRYQKGGIKTKDRLKALIVALGIVLLAGIAAAQIDDVPPVDDIKVVTLVDPAPVFDPETQTWSVPEGFDPMGDPQDADSIWPDDLVTDPEETSGLKVVYESSVSRTVVFYGVQFNSFGDPLFGDPCAEEIEKPGKVILNAVSPDGIEVKSVGGKTNLKNWSIAINGETAYVFEAATILKDEKFGVLMNVGDCASVQLFDAGGIEIDSVGFTNEKPNFLYHRVPDGTGPWQWIMGKVITGTHW